jgi:hypothetical protein
VHRRGNRTCWLIGIANLCHPPTLVWFLTQFLPIATSRQRTSRVYHTFDTNYDPESPSLLPTLPATAFGCPWASGSAFPLLRSEIHLKAQPATLALLP